MVGRDPEADLHIDDEAVSWNHLEIERRGEVLMATDLDSRNGTALNGEPLDRPRRLRDGDTLIVGGHRLEVSTRSGDAGGATVPAASPRSRSPKRSGRPRRPWSPPTAARAPSPGVPPPAPRSPRRCTSASAPPSAASTPSPPSSTSPATPAASARA